MFHRNKTTATAATTPTTSSSIESILTNDVSNGTHGDMIAISPSSNSSNSSIHGTNNRSNGYHNCNSYLEYDKTMKTTKGGGGIFISYRIIIPFCLILITSIIVVFLVQMSFLNTNNIPILQRTIGTNQQQQHNRYRLFGHHNDNRNSIHTLRTQHSHINTFHQQQQDQQKNLPECRWYLAESAIPQSGLGIFTAIGLHKDDMIGYPDICIFVSDGPDHWTHLRSHSFGRGSFFGQYEGRTNRAACEGIITTVNTVPDAMVNMEMVSPILPTNAGLHRAISPGAGANTHHYGIHGKAIDIITAGSEITINYGDWDFNSDDNKTYKRKPSRDVAWLQQHGWCIDQIDIDISTIPHAGRGAFARVPISRGMVVAPAPVQVFQDRDIFKNQQSEQLYVNYCLQPKQSKMLLFPYGQGVNLINHSYKQPNVEWRWSTNTINQMHHGEYLDLSYKEFWNIVSPGSLILEVVALRDIEPGEELLINYGASWEEAWNLHVNTWQPPINASSYVYPTEIDDTEPVRTVKEQIKNPYPNNLITMCLTSDFQRNEYNHIEWSEPTDYAWSEGMVYCHVLERKYNRKIGDDLYTVSLLLDSPLNDYTKHDPSIPFDDIYIDFHVPRRAIRFIEVPYMDDEHLPMAFRHPIELPDHLVPEAWKDVQ
jgi:hypothetical protein